MAKKHREDAARAEYIRSLGRAPIYTGNPAPPITAESIFGPTSPPPPTDTDENMDVDTVSFTPPVNKPLPPPPVITSDSHLPPRHHPILENDFQPEDDPDHPPCPLGPYDEDLENMAREEELRAFSNIRYGVPPVLKLSHIEMLIVPGRGKPQ